MPKLTGPIADLHGVGPSTANKLAKLGITTVIDLLSYFPIRHEDLRRVTPIAKLHTDVTSVIRGRLQLVTSRRGYRRRKMSVTEGLVADRTGTVKVVWFNQPYLANSFKPGDQVFLVGKLVNGAYGPQLQSPLIEKAGQERLLAGRILPIYRATAGLTQRQIRSLITAALPLAAKVPDWIPPEVRSSERLIPLASAVSQIHFPTSPQKLAAARERLKFDELLPFMLATLRIEATTGASAAYPISFSEEHVRTFVRCLPFTLTDDQRRAAWQVLGDMSQRHPMRRLLEGDVGSGKTAVAAVALESVARNGLQGAFLAPTDILARQHYDTLKKMYAGKVTIALLTGTQRERSDTGTVTKKQLLSSLSASDISLLIGTHAILNEKVVLPKLALVVVDEQHRFGVEQRRTLQRKNAGTVPHLLSMTATPIPRTLALALYGSLRPSFIRQLPSGRIPVATRVTRTADETVWDTIIERSHRKEQAFVVCPLIEESDELGVVAATTEFERLSRGSLSALRCGLLHGKLPAKEKHRVLNEFRHRTIDVLVTTPVVEVGVDIPAATVMVIEGAERFGLAQLHQLRGRVGRSSAPSECILMTDSENPSAVARLSVLERTTDGFALAEEDLKLRGPGDLYGIRQSGLPQFRMVSLNDLDLMERVRSVAESLIRVDAELARFPQLKKKADTSFRALHLE